MANTTIGTSNLLSTARQIINSVRTQIPDPVSDPADDGAEFSMQQLLAWINDGMRIMCAGAPVIQDWDGVPSSEGMDVYVLPNYINSVEQVWYNRLPLLRSPESNALFTSKITARSWWFGPHSIHVNPRMHVWPACDTSGASGLVDGAMTPEDSTFTITNGSAFNTYGYMRVENELVLFRNIDSNGLVYNILRGQGGTTAVAHNDGAVVRDCNIFFKCYRLPVPLTGIDDIIEVPQALWPIIELYVLSKCRFATQAMDEGMGLMKEFDRLVDRLAEKSPQLKGLRQGMQVKVYGSTPELWQGRVIIP